jgi:hypothetical protein
MWSALLACIAVFFGFIAIVGLIGYFAGCRNPNRVLMKKSKPPKLSKYLDNDENEDAVLRMLDTPEKDYEHSFKNSRLTSHA